MLKIKIVTTLFLLFLISCSIFKEEPIKPEPTIEFKIKILDESNNPTYTFYSLDVYSNISNIFSQIRQGQFEPSYNIISNLPQNNIYQFNYWTNNHYKKKELIKYPHSNYLSTLKFNEADKKGKINVSFIGNLELDKENLIILNISVDGGSFKRASICFDNSVRIIYTRPKNDYVICDSYWVNYSYYPNNNSQYNLPKNQYKCYNNGYIENCNKIEYSKCFSGQISVPELLKNKAINCFKIGKDIKGHFEYPLLVKAMSFIKDDYITIYLIDEENRIYNFTRRFYET